MAEEMEPEQQETDPCCLVRFVQDADEQMRRRLRANVAYYARRPDRIDKRLRDLDREWDVERVVAFGAGAATLTGLALGLFRKKWALLPIAVGALLVAHSVDGCCRPAPCLRCLGLRTRREIEQERYALKALRGDFNALAGGEGSDAEENAARAIESVELD